VVLVEGESVMSIEPAEVASAALFTASDCDHFRDPRYNDYLDAEPSKTIHPVSALETVCPSADCPNWGER
jgi:hypothetical protein